MILLDQGLTIFFVFSLVSISLTREVNLCVWGWGALLGASADSTSRRIVVFFSSCLWLGSRFCSHSQTRVNDSSRQFSPLGGLDFPKQLEGSFGISHPCRDFVRLSDQQEPIQLTHGSESKPQIQYEAILFSCYMESSYHWFVYCYIQRLTG